MSGRVGAAVFIAVTIAAIGAAPAFAAGPVVVTPDGALEGVATATGKEWRGIPYAVPPIGALRWRPPAPLTPWAGVRDATAFGSPCLQPAGFDSEGNVTATLGSEDCLFLNVFAPADATAGSGLPVMVHIHGGGNGFGSGQEDAAGFVSHGVIVVTLNHRLGVLGFAGHPALSAEGGGSSGEYGMLDQIAALQWVRRNIASFGGDPSNVTAFGFSSGSFDTVALMVSPLARGLIRRAAVQGEAYWALTGTFATIGDAETIGLTLAASSGCGSDLACLRALPADIIVRAAGFFDVPPWVGGVVLPRSPIELVEEGSALPLLAGFNREEDSIFEWPFLADPFTNVNWIHTTTLLVGPPLAGRARALYPASEYESLKWAYITMATDAKRGCPTRRLALASSLRVPVYRYLFTHVLENDPEFAIFKSTHGMEDVLLWGRDWYVPSSVEEVLSDQMRRYWTNFARVGDPNEPGLPVWPTYDRASESILTLDTDIQTISGYHAAQCALLDTVAPFSFDPAFSRGRKAGLFDFLP